MNDESMHAFLAAAAGRVRSIEPLRGDASIRRYWRVEASRGGFILCRDEAFIGAEVDTYPFVAMQRLLSGVVPVPSILAIDPAGGYFLLDDLGDILLEYAVPSMDYETLTKTYRSCIDNLLRIQTLRGEGGCFSLCFDRDKLMFEFEFFIDHALWGYWRSDISDEDITALRREFNAIAEELYRPDLFVLNHRDYHSRNIIIHRGIPFIIDFQDARMGLPQYDVASLLRDSYVHLPDHIYIPLHDYCYERGRGMGIHRLGRDEYDYLFDVMAFQRNVKALGTFGYQVSMRGNLSFERYIAPTLSYLEGYACRRGILAEAWRIISRFAPIGGGG